jgi:putative transposase
VYGDRKIHRDLQDYGEVHVITPNTLAREFKPSQPNQSWVTDITYIRTHEGWLYLGIVMDLYSRKIIGWSMGSRMVKELIFDALFMAVWRRKPGSRVIVHSDQGSQYTSYEWQEFLKEHGLEGSMSRRGNCHDNAVAESFFQRLKRERIKKRIYLTREIAKQDIFNYIEMFYNSVRRHTANNLLSPRAVERRFESETGTCLLN